MNRSLGPALGPFLVNRNVNIPRWTTTPEKFGTAFARAHTLCSLSNCGLIKTGIVDDAESHG